MARVISNLYITPGRTQTEQCAFADCMLQFGVILLSYKDMAYVSGVELLGGNCTGDVNVCC